MTVTWHSFDLRSGRRGQRLFTQQQGAVERIIGEATDFSGLSVRLQEGWDAATLGGRAMIAALDESEQPLWAGMVVRRRSGPGEWVNVDLVTHEAYFDRRYVKDHTYTQVSQGGIVAALIASDVKPDGIEFVVDAVSPQLRDRAYVDDEDKTVFSVLQELMEVEGGPEFTVDLEWRPGSDRRVLDRVLRVRDRLGSASTTPKARFDLPGCVTTFEYVEDFSAEVGANDVLASSSGEGEARPESRHMVDTTALAQGWARFEHRFSPSTSITQIDTLDAHARSRLSQMRDGANQLTLTARREVGPQVGVDFWLGDNVAVSLTCPRFPARVDADGAVGSGYESVERCIGYRLDFDANTIEPRFLEGV